MEKSFNYIKEHLNIDSKNITFYGLDTQNDAPKGYRVKLHYTAYFSIENYTDNGRTLHFVSCDLNNPCSIKHYYHPSDLDNHDSMIKADKLAEIKNVLDDNTDNLFTGYLPVSYLKELKIDLQNVFSIYSFFMKNVGEWDNKPYKPNDILRNSSHNIPNIMNLKQEDISLVKII